MPTLWTELYRPKTLDDCVLPKRIKKVIQGYIKNKNPENLMLTGSQGTGKTTLAKALINDLNAEMLYVDCSTDNGKQMLIDTVIPYASSISIVNQDMHKFILMDECLLETETIRIGTLNDFKDIPLKELKKNQEYPVISFNLQTNEFENDSAYLCTDKKDELYEVIFSNNQKIVCNVNHPFIVIEDGTLKKKRLIDGLWGAKTFLDSLKVIEIKEINKLNKKGRVLDVHVRKNHTFITTGGLVTSNCDFLTPQSQASLRPIIERFHGTARFIFTANYEEKIIPALKSRCVSFDFSYKKEDKPELMLQFFKRCSRILQENKIDYDKKVLAEYISKIFPDYRKIINELQAYSSGFEKIDSGILGFSNGSLASEIYPLLVKKKFEDVKKWVYESVNSPEDIFTALFNSLSDYVPKEKQPDVIVILAQYQFWASSVANQKINLMACLTEIMGNL